MFKHVIKKSDKKVVYLLIAILALVITFVNALFFLPLKKYQLKIIKVVPKQPKDIISYVAYDDLDRDHYNEKILIVKYKANAVNHFIKVFDKKDSVVFKFGLNKKRERWLPSTLWTGDFNGDSLKEIYIFSSRHFAVGRDSVFLYVFNPFGENKILVNRRCILNSTDNGVKPGKVFRPEIKIVGLFNLSTIYPGKELVFSAFAPREDAQLPHNLFAFNIIAKKIIRRSPYLTAAELSKFFVEKKGKEIFFYPSRYQVTKETSNPFFALDTNLNIVKKRDINAPRMSFIMGKDFYLTYTSSIKETTINLVDSAFNTLKSKKLEHKFIPVKNNFTFSARNRKIDPVYFVSLIFEKNYRLDKDLNLKKISSHQVGGGVYLCNNVCLRNGIIGIRFIPQKNIKRLTVYRENFKDAVSVDVFMKGDRDRIYSIKEITPNSMVLSLSTQYQDTEIWYGRNPYYYFNFAFIGLEFGVVYFILYVIFLFFNTLIFYYHFLARHLNTIDKGVLLLSFEGKVLHYNQNFVKLLNLGQDVHLGVTYSHLFHRLPQVNSFIERLIKSDKDLSEEITIQKEDSIFKGKLMGYHLTGISGIPSGYSIELYDLSERILTEREEIITRLIRKMAHDIRTPLSTIKFSIETIKYVLPSQEWEKIREDIDTMSKEVNHVQAITDNYSKFARLSRQNLQVISLREVITTVLSKYELPGSIKITLNVDAEAEVITADGKQFELMIKELFENALDAIGNEGEIRFDIFPENEKKQNGTPKVCLRISDNGKGIPRKIIDRIFEPNFSTKGQGTGFGLVLVQRIVQNHNGIIWVDSEVGKGTQIYIVLPKDNIPNMNPKE